MRLFLRVLILTDRSVKSNPDGQNFILDQLVGFPSNFVQLIILDFRFVKRTHFQSAR